MYIKKIRIYDFRNYESQIIELEKGKNIFYGNNAQGKTNIIEAIFLCSFGKSFRTKKEKELINLKKEIAEVEIEYEKSDREGKIKLEIKDKKSFYINGIKANKLSEILGKINIVLFNPDSIEIAKEGPSKRRRFIDMLIGQLNPVYIYNINQYLNTLEQRNAYLKQIKYENKSEEMLEIWDENLNEYAKKIYNIRKMYLEKINEKIVNIHKKITKEKEEIEIEYISNYNSDYLNKLKESRKIDILRGYTNYGIHRDDFNIRVNGNLVSVFGSQGQQRSSIISLKLAELEVIYDEIGEYPILLLDDFMSELDKERREKFLENIKENQVIITSTDKFEIKDSNYYCVKSGKVTKEN